MLCVFKFIVLLSTSVLSSSVLWCSIELCDLCFQVAHRRNYRLPHPSLYVSK